MTDGDDTASSIPLEVVLKLAKQYRIKIYTIAIGATNTNTLKQLSQETQGESFIALNKKDLQEIYTLISQLEKTKLDQNRLVLKEYYFFYPLIFSFLFLLIFIYLKNKYTN